MSSHRNNQDAFIHDARIWDFGADLILQTTELGLAGRILQVLAQNPDKILLADDASRMSGRQIAERLSALVDVIEKCSPEGGRVGLLMPNSAAKGLSVLAVFVARRVPVMLNGVESYNDPSSALMRMNLHALITERVLSAGIRVEMPVIRLDGQAQVREIEKANVRNKSALPSPGTALILYTSGSSGEPKGVQLSEAALLYNIRFLMDYLDLNGSTVATVLLPVCHTMALNTQFLPTFLAGGESVFFEASLSLGRIYRGILESRGTCIALVADLVRLCHEEKIRRDLPAAEHVRQVTLAGGVIRAHHLEMARELFPNAILYKGYGLTEAIRVSMIDSRDPDFLSNTAGYVLPGQSVEIRDDENKLLPVGQLGHLYVQGPNVMIGYDGDAPSPLAEGFLRTNDMGMLTTDGQLVIHGRSDGIVKVRGKRVSLKEIEEAAMALVPAAREIRCLAMPDERTELSLVLYLEMGAEPEGEALSHESLAAFEAGLRKRVRDHHSLPKDIFVLKEFPRTPNGKIKLFELKEMWTRRHRFQRLGKNADARNRLRFFADGETLRKSDYSQATL